jgi:hypothetical protein
MNKAEKYNIIFIITFMTIGITVLYLNSDNEEYNLRSIEFYDFLDTTMVVYENDGRKYIALNDSLKVFKSFNLVENKSNFNDWIDHKPIISFTKEPYRYKIRDVRFPYKVYKRMNSDTIEVFKDTFKLKFKIRKLKKN